MTDDRPIFYASAPQNPRPVGTLLTELAAQAPDQPAISFGDETRTRMELEISANRIAREMAAAGVGKGDIVMIVLPTSADYHAFTFAAWKLGAVPSPVSPKLPDRELQGLVELANPKLIVGVDADRIPGRRTMPLGHQPDPTLSADPLPEVLGPHWKASTSGGSTGRPKIIVDHMLPAFDPDATMLGIKKNDVMLHPAPMYHNAPFAQTHMALYWGGHVVLMPRFDPIEWLRLVEQHRVQWAYLVPTMMSRIIKLPAEERDRFDLSSLQMVMHMAAACPVWLKQAWIDWLGPDMIWEIYGSTESTGGTRISGREWLEHKGSVGRPDPSRSHMKILRDDGTECLPGEVGELYFRPAGGKGSTYHYLGAEPKDQGDYETLGDLGHVDEDGYLYLADRRVDMIVSGGANIYPAEIEAALEQRSDIVAALVVGLPDEDLGARAHALIQPADPASPPDPAELYAFLKDQLVSYKLPYTFEFVTDMLRDDAGKSRRLAIRDERAQRLAAGHRFTPLRPAREAA